MQRAEELLRVASLAKKLWSGRFAGSTDSRVEAFTQSISFDHRLFKQDIRCSNAHARMLASVGLITVEECQQIVRSLSEIEAEIESGTLALRPELEDIHMNIETVLIERLGDVGRKVHTARSRNDQVVTDLKLWAREAIDRVSERVTRLQRAFVDAATRYPDLILPGYTHLQRAQPVLAAHVLLAYVEKLERDQSRLADCRRRLNVLPLGAAALAGTSLPIDRDFVARELEFERPAANSLDVSSDRDFVLESVFVLTMIAEHLAGWAEEWILWSTQEFGFLSLPDAICTGSSMMPQKKNPDVLELIRGRTARVVGDLTALLVLVKGLPLAYNRDLQEDKERLFDSADTVRNSTRLMAGMIAHTTVNEAQCRAAAADPALLATDLADALVRKGLPFRQAHQIVGAAVAAAARLGRPLDQLTPLQWQEISPAFEAGVLEVFDLKKALARRNLTGAPSPQQIARQLARWRKILSAA